MPSQSTAESGKRFARDMRRVRETRGITVDDLHEETKIPIGLLESFEETALFDHSQFNRVYLRSFVRTYANVVGIEPDTALQALEESLSDQYAGSVAVAYLGEEPDVESTAEEEPADIPAADRAPKEAPPVRESEKPATARDRGDVEDQPTRRPETESRSETRAEPGPSRRGEPRDRGAKPTDADRRKDEPRTSKPPVGDVRFEDASRPGDTGIAPGNVEAGEESEDDEWTAQSPPRSRGRATPPTTKTPPRRGRRRERPSGSTGRWIAAAAAVVAVAAIVWVAIAVIGQSPPAEQELPSAFDTTGTVDTTMTEDPSLETRAVMPTIGDTLNVQVIAAVDKVDPIRVTIDDDLRRPYWLDQGDSMTFRPTERIVLEELLDNIELRIEGAEYPTNRRDDLGRIVITRDSLRAYFRPNEAE